MFITFEGIEGSGKTSQIDPIASFLNDQGVTVVVTREPGATAIGKKIRSILLDPGHGDLSPLGELLLYAADRAQHLAQIVRPALQEGKTVLCDRFFDATFAYQGAARGLDMGVVNAINDYVVQGLKPDLTLLFDLSPAIGLQRTFDALEKGLRSQKESRFEQEELQFHEQVRQGYLKLAQKEPDRFLTVDAARSRQRVYQQIISGIKDRIR